MPTGTYWAATQSLSCRVEEQLATYRRRYHGFLTCSSKMVVMSRQFVAIADLQLTVAWKFKAKKEAMMFYCML